MTHKIAIITSREFYSDYDGENYNKIVTSITDWEEVSDEDFKMLQQASYRLDFHILEQPTDIKGFVAKTISDYKVIVKEAELAEAKAKKEREDAALARRIKKELKDKGSKEKMLHKLAEELGVNLSGLPEAKLPI